MTDRPARSSGARQAHRMSALVLAACMGVIGGALVVQYILAAAGGVTGRLLLGILFLAAGAGRVYVEVRRGRKA